MKKSKFTSLIVLLAGLFPFITQGQISGQYPLLLINKNNGYQMGVGKLPVVDGDVTGRFQIRGWVSDGFYHPGAEIKSIVTGPVLNDGFPADLYFSTGYPSLTHRMVITADGNVGIGTDNPLFNLHTEGNTHTSGDFYGRIHFDDNQTTDDAPSTYIDEAYFELKQRSVLNLPAGLGTHGGLLTLAPGSTSFDHQLFFAEDGMFTRRWGGNENSWAGATWYKILTGEDINGTENQIAKFTGPNSLGDSQLFDDGTQVGIGTSTPSAGYFLEVSGNTLISNTLNATGNVETGADLGVAGSATVGGNLDVTGSADIDGNADIMGRLHVDNLVTIGTNNTPPNLGVVNTTGYRLFVEGGILTDEVLVRTGWADYVFASTYQLPTLEEVKAHILKEGHLPNVPSAQEVESNGLKLADMTVNQQEKIEELFLYLIDLNDEVKTLKAENESLKEKVNQLEGKH
jgi:cytoskeletal protein CcmA (bactofilin family)